MDILISLRQSLRHLENQHVEVARRCAAAPLRQVSTRKDNIRSLDLANAHGISDINSSSSEWGADLKLLLQTGLFHAHRMDRSACPMLALVTDGVLQLNDATLFGSILGRLSNADVRLAILQITVASFQPARPLGLVPDVGIDTSPRAFEFFQFLFSTSLLNRFFLNDRSSGFCRPVDFWLALGPAIVDFSVPRSTFHHKGHRTEQCQCANDVVGIV